MSDKGAVVNLRMLAERVGLAPCSVSAVLNRTPASRAIPQQTQERVFRAAAELNYQPNLSARSLRTKRTQIIAIISNDFGRVAVGYLAGILERRLRGKGYLLVLAGLDRPSEWTRLSVQLRQRGVEGVIIIGASLPGECGFPLVSVHLASRTAAELPKDAIDRIAELGESIIETLLAKIEALSGLGKARIFRQTPAADFIAATGSASAIEFRE